MVVQQVLLVAVCVALVDAYPPNPLLPMMRRRYGGGGGDYPTIKLPFPIPVKPSLLNKLEDVALDVLYDFRQLVREEIRSSRTTTTTPAPSTPAQEMPLSQTQALLKEVQELKRKSDCKSDNLQDSPAVRPADNSLLGLSFKDDCVQIAIGGQKIFRRCGQRQRQRMFRDLPDAPLGAFATSSVDHDTTLFVKNPNPASSDFDPHPGRFPMNQTQGGPNPPNLGGPSDLSGNVNPSHPTPGHPQNNAPFPPPHQNSPSHIGPIQNTMPYPQNSPPPIGPIQNTMPHPVGNNQFLPPFGEKGSRYIPSFDGKSWYPQPFGSKTWNMPPHDGKSWGMPPFVGTGWNMPHFDGKSWYPQTFGTKSWTSQPFYGQNWPQQPLGTKSWNYPPYPTKSWNNPPYPTKSWNNPPYPTKSWNNPPYPTKSWSAYPYPTKTWYPQMSEVKSWNSFQPLIQPHGFISPEKGGYPRHFHFSGGVEPPRPPPPPPPAGAPYDDPYYNKPFHFHKNPIQHSYQEPALPRRGRAYEINDDVSQDSKRNNFNGREIRIPFPNNLKGDLSFPETDLSSVLQKAASMPRRSGDRDPMLVVAMPKEGDDARPGEFHPPIFVPLQFSKDDDIKDDSSVASDQDSYLPNDEFMERPPEMISSEISSNIRNDASMK